MSENDSIYLHKLGYEKIKKFNNEFDQLYDFYKQKAQKSGYHGELKFIKEHGKIVVFVVINQTD